MLCKKCSRIRPAAAERQWASHAAGRGVQRRAPGAPQQSSRRRGVVANTSEFWYEDEEEFDALTEVLDPKRIVLATPEAVAANAAALQGVPFVTAFASPAALPAAEQLWEQLGRSGPPLFLKVRSRLALGQLEASPAAEQSAAVAVADGVWKELLTQSWKTELDYGLGKREEGSAVEQVLLLAGASAVAALSAAVEGGSSSGSGSGGFVEVSVSGWNQGVAEADQLVLGSWRDLKPRIVAGNAAR